jgi:hypothetical protein
MTHSQGGHTLRHIARFNAASRGVSLPYARSDPQMALRPPEMRRVQCDTGRGLRVNGWARPQQAA